MRCSYTTREDRTLWDFLDKTAITVSRWPEFMRGNDKINPPTKQYMRDSLKSLILAAVDELFQQDARGNRDEVKKIVAEIKNYLRRV